MVREYINFFMKMHMQWSKEDGSNSFSWTLIISRLPCFEKLNLSQLQLYIKAQTMTQFAVCRNYKRTILTWSTEGKVVFLYFTHVKDPYWFAEVE